MTGREITVNIEVDPRLFDAVVTFTGEVAEVAATLRNLRMDDEAGRLLQALDDLDDAGKDDGRE